MYDYTFSRGLAKILGRRVKFSVQPQDHRLFLCLVVSDKVL